MKRKIQYIIDRSYCWGRSIYELDNNDMILVGYPKTGSTWIRYFLYSLLSQGMDNVSYSIDAMNDAMPEFAHSSFFKKWPFDEIPRIIKTHQRYLPFFKGKKAVLLVRDPRDIVVSYYHYLNGLKASRFHGSITDVLKSNRFGLHSFFKHYKSWEHQVGLILRYEDFKKDPFTNFSLLAEYYGIIRDREDIELSIERSNFSNMRLAQNKSSNLKSEFKKGHQFVRTGKKAQWKDLFSNEDMDFYENLKKNYMFNLYS